MLAPMVNGGGQEATGGRYGT